MTEPSRKSIVSHLPPELLERVDDALVDFSADDLRRLVESQISDRHTQPDNRLIGGVRWQDAIIAEAVPPGATVLDLGCGCGTLLGQLIRDKGVCGQGVEIDFEAVVACLENGIPVFQADLDEGLAGFPDQAVDVVILEETIQTLRQPTKLLTEVLRVGREAWISFPNFACWKVRLGLALEGQMPVTEELPYHWYNTPNIHLLTLRDFRNWAAESNVKIAEGHALVGDAVRPLHEEQDNLLAEEVLLRIVPE
jgi:methionine biosynthesis protein MetW